MYAIRHRRKGQNWKWIRHPKTMPGIKNGYWRSKKRAKFFADLVPLMVKCDEVDIKKVS